MSTSLSKDHILFRSSADVQQICQPLKQHFGIETFSYVKVNPDLSRIHLDTNVEWNELFYKNFDYYNEDGLTEAQHWESGIAVMHMLDEHACIQDAMAFNIGNGIVISRHENNHTELAYFALGCDATNRDLITLINNQDLMKNFLDYFKFQAKNIIHQASKDPIKIPSLKATNVIRQFNDANEQRSAFLSKLGASLKQEIPLSMRELEVLHWQSLGKTAEEVALILSISVRTVKAHIRNIKDKLECVNQFQLGSAYKELSQLIDTSNLSDD
jgi:DNA-binding CsgD family transcriptional regulator